MATSYVSPPRRLRAGFTLVELLVAMAVLALILVLVGQIISHTSSTIGSSTRNISVDQMAGTVLDRIGAELSAMVTKGPATLIAIKNTSGSDGLAFVSNGRGEDLGYATNSIRLSVWGCGVAPQSDYVASGSTSTALPMVCLGSGALLFNGTNGSWEQATTNMLISNTVLQAAANDVSNWMSATAPVTTAGAGLGAPEPLNLGTFRLEVCFLRSDGQLINGSGTSTNALPLNRNFLSSAAAGSVTQYPVAFNAKDTNLYDANGNPLYVRAIVVGIAVIDPQSQKQLGPTLLNKLSSTNVFPKAADGQSPLQAWDFSRVNSSPVTYNQLSSISPLALRYIHIYQRYFYVD